MLKIKLGKKMATIYIITISKYITRFKTTPQIIQKRKSAASPAAPNIKYHINKIPLVQLNGLCSKLEQKVILVFTTAI